VRWVSLLTPRRCATEPSQAGSSGWAPALICVCRLLGVFDAEQRQTGRGLPCASTSCPEQTPLRSPCVWTYVSWTQDVCFVGCLLLAHCHKPVQMAASPAPKGAFLASCRCYVAHPRRPGWRRPLRLATFACLLALTILRTVSKPAGPFVRDGLARSVPWDWRPWGPRQSTPLATQVTTVLSCESASPRSFLHCSTPGLPSPSSRSVEVPGRMQSSASLTMGTVRRSAVSAWGVGHCSVRLRSRPSSARLARTGETTPPTKVQTFFSRVRLLRVRVDPTDKIDRISTHFHSPHQGPDAVALARPVCLS